MLVDNSSPVSATLPRHPPHSIIRILRPRSTEAQFHRGIVLRQRSECVGCYKLGFLVPANAPPDTERSS